MHPAEGLGDPYVRGGNRKKKKRNRNLEKDAGNTQKRESLGRKAPKTQEGRTVGEEKNKNVCLWNAMSLGRWLHPKKKKKESGGEQSSTSRHP